MIITSMPFLTAIGSILQHTLLVMRKIVYKIKYLLDESISSIPDLGTISSVSLAMR